MILLPHGDIKTTNAGGMERCSAEASPLGRCQFLKYALVAPVLNHRFVSSRANVRDGCFFACGDRFNNK